MTYSNDAIPQEYREGAEIAAKALDKLEDALIAGHVNPDGDAIGSIIAAAHILAAKGKNFAIYLPDKLPHNLSFVKFPGPVYKSLAEIPFSPKSAVYVDCSEQRRLSPELATLPPLPTVNIDHHICNAPLGTVANFIQPDAAATCQLMAYVAESAGMPLRGNLAGAIAIGILTDTGHFSHANTNSPIYQLAALLEENGCNLHEISEHLHNGMPLAQVKLWGHLLQRIHTRCQGRVAVCKVWLDDLERAKCDQTDLEGFVDWLRRIENVEIGLLIRQILPQSSKFSLRSRGNTDVQKLATFFGGGGHKNAAGGTLDEDPDKAEILLMVPIRKYLEHQQKI